MDEVEGIVEGVRPRIIPNTKQDQFGTTWVSAVVDPQGLILAGYTEGGFTSYVSEQDLYDHCVAIITFYLGQSR